MAAVLAYISAAFSFIWIQLLVSPPPGRQPVTFPVVDDLPFGVVCPGDVLTYTAVVKVEEAGTLEIYPTIRRANDNAQVLALAADPKVAALVEELKAPLVGDTVIPARAGDAFRTAFTEDELPATLQDPEARFVVPDLPPGRYQRILTAALANRNAIEAMRVQLFEIGDDCP